MAAVVVFGYGSVVVYGHGLVVVYGYGFGAVVVYGYGFGAVVVGDRGDDDGAVAARQLMTRTRNSKRLDAQTSNLTR